MEYLHNDHNKFNLLVTQTRSYFYIRPDLVEKDYYVTMILRELSKRKDYVVFKGGTSLSKCHKVIKRFSEDIDITIDTKISQGQMKDLKETIKDIADSLGLNIPNINETRSRRSYNRYVLNYRSVFPKLNNAITTAVLMETSFAEVSFPTVLLPVTSYIGEYLKIANSKELKEYGLEPFEMKVQGLDRTLADKVFAICDYHLAGQIAKHSRHIYDIHKLLPLVPLTEEFKVLVREVRKKRAKTTICPSAQPEIDIPKLLETIIETNAYKEDYENITTQILEENVSYETAIEAIRIIARSGMFE